MSRHIPQQQGIEGLRPTTRYITTHDATSGKSIFVSPQEPLYFVFRTNDFGVARLYGVQHLPAAHLAKETDLQGYLSDKKEEHPTSFARVGDELTIPEGVNFTQLDMAPAAYIGMHRTVSIDFVAVVEGEVVVELDSGESRVLRRGVSLEKRWLGMYSWVEERANLSV